jgi:DNA-binding transcriptional regulator YbjK
MGVKERRAREKSETGDKILDAARELFVTEGYEGVSMRLQVLTANPLSLLSRMAELAAALLQA